MSFKDSFAWRAGCLLGASGILLGAFGAHGLKNILKGDVKKIENWKTAANYQLMHATTLLVIGAVAPQSVLAAKLMAFGTTAFSGSIYLLTLNPVAFKMFGPVTPIGGLGMMAGWAALLF